MSNFKYASLGAKTLTISIVALLLSMGLCGVGWGGDGKMQGFLAAMGILLFGLSIVGFLLSVIFFATGK